MPGATRSFTATLDHDPKNAGVTWTLSGAGCSGDSCGTLANVTGTSVAYHAPAAEPSPHTVTLMATSVTDVNQIARVTLTVSANPFLLEGKYAFLINGWWNGIMEAIAGQFTADGNGGLTGVWDANRGAAADVAQAISGTYNIQPDGHGIMTIRAGSATFMYIVSVDAAGATARFAESTVPPGNEHRGSSGYMARRDTNSFNLSPVEGDRVIAVYGEATGSHVAALGHIRTGTGTSNDSIIITGTGSPQDSIIDLSWDITSNTAKFPNTVPLSGKFGAPDASTGRGTAELTVGTGATATYHFAYYTISETRLLLVQTDARGFIGGLLIPTLSGEIRLQENAGAFTNASLNSPFVFDLTNADMFEFGIDAPMVRLGQMAPNGSGARTTTLDQNVGNSVEFSGPLITLNATFTGTYSVSANGRATWSIEPGLKGGYYGNAATIAYLVAENEGYFMTPDADGAAFGAFEPQSGGPFSVAAMAGTYLLNTGPPAMPQVENSAGWMTLDENGNGIAVLYVNAGSGPSPLSLTAAVTVASNGRGTLVLNTTPPSVARNLVFWAISPDRWVAISTVNPDDTKPVLLFIERQ
ncbi:MAG: hypothetical protein LAO06_05515 [Acidobacteriia bacterium]|nr:hypothetical protein [Terriglobia bacterium]